MISAPNNARNTAVAVLQAWRKGHAYADSLIEQYAKQSNLTQKDKTLSAALVFSVLRNKNLLDHWISKLREGKLDSITRDILYIGLSQILLLRTSDHAAVNETVNCAKKSTRGLVNAVLRRAIREKEILLDQKSSTPLHIQSSHPKWLINHWVKLFGEKKTIRLLEWNNTPADAFIRLNRLHPELANGEDLKIPDTIALEAVPEASGFFHLQSSLPESFYRDGFVYGQDPSTRHGPALLNAQPGECILDACAAPGGKAGLIAASMQNQGELVVSDVNEKRIPRLKQNIERLKITIAQYLTHDWTKPANPQWNERFDGILLDVPCSNTGVFRRRVDARWRLTPENIKELVTIQTSILHNAVKCLKVGGRLVYSTCSIDPAENADLIQAFLNSHPNFNLQEERQILPFLDHTDGAYAALLQKNHS